MKTLYIILFFWLLCLFINDIIDSKKPKRCKVEYIPIKNKCTYHYPAMADKNNKCMNCGKLVSNPPGEYIDGYTMIITYPDGRKEGWIVDEAGK